MPFRFPHVEEVKLERSPLQEVVCQVRYPMVLRIIEHEPTGLQEAIRDRFPELQIESSMTMTVETSERPRPIGGERRIYRFGSPDGSRMLSLAPDFYALSTTAYSGWTAFADDLGYVHEAILREYAIPHAKRVGLRYINHIDASFTESGDPNELLGLVKDSLVPLIAQGIVSAPKVGFSRYESKLSENTDENLTFQFGIVPRGPDAESVFLLDFDAFVTAVVPLHEVLARCDRFHTLIHDAFRWCIREEKLHVFCPRADGRETNDGATVEDD